MTESDSFIEDQQIILSTLELLKTIPWEELSLISVAQAMRLSPLILYQRFMTKADLLKGILRYMDEKTLKSYGEGDEGASPGDALFDLVMCRLESLEPHKDAIRSLSYGLWHTPCNALEAYPSALESLRWMLEVSHISTAGILGMIKLKGFAIVYTVIIKTWLEDTAGDLSKTMLTVDRLLKQVDPFLRGM